MKFTTLEYKDGKLVWIDQTALPDRLDYKTSSDYNEIITAIKRLEVRGAPAIGIAAAYGLAIAVKESVKIDKEMLHDLANEFKRSRPTAVNLFWAIDRMVDAVKDIDMIDKNRLVAALVDEAKRIHDEDIEMCRKIGEAGADLIPDNSTILTHCNAGALATGGIGTALGVIYTCQQQGKKINVFADETRPLLQGARLTAWELQQEGINVTLITDNMAGMLMRQGTIDAVIVGADRVTKNGDVANKIGTYAVAVLAKENNIPFYVAFPSSTYDLSLETGDEIVIEQREPVEITHGFGKQTAPDNIPTYNPAFDVTPARYISYYITDKGLTKGERG